MFLFQLSAQRRNKECEGFPTGELAQNKCLTNFVTPAAAFRPRNPLRKHSVKDAFRLPPGCSMSLFGGELDRLRLGLSAGFGPGKGRYQFTAFRTGQEVFPCTT